VDHSRALGHAADPHPLATEIGLQGDLLEGQIGGEDGAGGGGAPRRAQGRHQWIEPRQQGVDRDRHADHAGGADQHLLGLHVEFGGHCGGGAQAVDQASLAGAGIGLTGVGEHGPGTAGAFSQALGAEVDAGGPHPVGGEAAGADGPLWRQQQGEIGLAGGLQPSGDPRRLKPHWRGDPTGDGMPGGAGFCGRGAVVGGDHAGLRSWEHPAAGA